MSGPDRDAALCRRKFAWLMNFRIDSLIFAGVRRIPNEILRFL